MPSVRENVDVWNGYSWSQQGDEWSAPWGSADREWQVSVYPRIARSLANRPRVLEIGPGMGRWTRRLLPLVTHLDVVDISEKALQGLTEVVLNQLPEKDRHKVDIHLGSGVDLPVESGSVDFVFSFDSLVHADEETLNAYLMECSRVLADNGSGFIHHANRTNPIHWRGTATAISVLADCKKAGLYCYSQEVSTWVHEQNAGFIDCFTSFGKADRGIPILTTVDVLAEAKVAKHLSAIYDR